MADKPQDANQQQAEQNEGSSTSTEQQTQGSETAKVESSSTESSKTFTDRAKEILQKAESETAKDDKQQGPTTTETTAESTVKQQGTEQTESEALPPFHEHPRWKEQQEKLKTLEAQNAALRQWDEQRQRYGLTPQQVNEALEMVALVQSNPTEARKRLEPLYNALSEATGTRLPMDLAQELNEAKEEVEDGTMTKARYEAVEKRLYELAKTRAQEARIAEQTRYANQAQQDAFHQNMMEVTKWEFSKTKADPDFRQGTPKMDMVSGLFGRLYHERQPKTAVEAVQLAEQAYNEISAYLQKLTPKPPARKTLSTNGSTTKYTPEAPKTAVEAMNRVLQKHSK